MNETLEKLGLPSIDARDNGTAPVIGVVPQKDDVGSGTYPIQPENPTSAVVEAEASDDPSVAIYRSAGQVAAAIPKAVSSLLALGGVACFIGWVYARSYFGQFGAGWIVPELAVGNLLYRAWIPVVVLAVFVYLSLSDLAIAEQKHVRRSCNILRFAWLFTIIPVSLLVMEYFVPSIHFSVMARPLFLSGLLLITASAVAALVSLKRVRLLQGDRFDVALALIALCTGLYFIPYELGRRDGASDRIAATSTLPVVSVAELQGELRLLHAAGDLAYVAQLREDDKFPEIKVLNLTGCSVTKTKKLTSPRTETKTAQIPSALGKGNTEPQ